MKQFPRSVWMLAILANMLFAAPALAQIERYDPPPASSAEAFPGEREHESDAALLDRVAAYLTDLTTIVADFTQVAPDGSLSTGKFYLKRPNKMRWQYDPPTPVLMLTR